MLEIAWFATRLFLKGQLLRDPAIFVRQIVFGTTVGLTFFLAIAQMDIPLGISVTTVSLLTGLIMPFLFRDFKMK